MDKFLEMEIFADVVARGSFSATARARALSPSGVSKLIQRLERRIGILLFKRDTRQVALTPEGQQFHQGVQRVLSTLADLESRSDVASSAELTGQLRILCSSGLATPLLVPHLPAFADAYPGLEIDIAGEPGMANHPLDPSIDLAFYSAEVPSGSLIARRIVTTHHVVCAAPTYLARWGMPASPEELLIHRCLNLSADAPGNRWPMQMPSGTVQRVSLQPKIVAHDAETLLALACAGLGIGRFLAFQVQDAIAAGRLVPLLEAHNPRVGQAIHAVYHSRRYVSASIQAFLDFLEARLAPGPLAVPAARPVLRPTLN